jgi:hypothetical protein
VGKGDKRRPTVVDEETFAERWKRTFKPEGKPEEDPRNQAMKKTLHDLRDKGVTR